MGRIWLLGAGAGDGDAQGDGQQEQGQGQEPGDQEKEYEVHPRKEQFEWLLLAEAERLGCRQPTRKGRLDCLARQCSTDAVLKLTGYKEPLAGSTLSRSLARPGPPDWSTLFKLVAGTGTPLVYWLLALGLLEHEQLAQALGQALGHAPLTPTERDWLSVIEQEGWTAEDARLAARFLRRLVPRPRRRPSGQ